MRFSENEIIHENTKKKNKDDSNYNLKIISNNIDMFKILIVLILTVAAILIDVILRLCFPVIKMSLSNEQIIEFKTLISFLSFCSNLINRYLFISISLVIFIFCNKLKFFLIVTIYYSSDMVGQILKIIYQVPRESWKDDAKLESCFGINSGFANPSGHCLTSILFYLGLYEIIISSIRKYINNFIKYLILSFFLTIILLVIFSRFILGYHTFSQILFGINLGLLSYYTTFYILFPDLNDFRNLLKFIRNKWTLTSYILVYLIVTIIVFLIYYLFSNWSTNAYYYFKIKNCKKNSNNMFSKVIISLFYFYSYFFTILAMKLYYDFFSDDEIKWVENYFHYNFEIQNQNQYTNSKNIFFENDEKDHNRGNGDKNNNDIKDDNYIDNLLENDNKRKTNTLVKINENLYPIGEFQKNSYGIFEKSSLLWKENESEKFIKKKTIDILLLIPSILIISFTDAFINKNSSILITGFFINLIPYIIYQFSLFFINPIILDSF